MLELCMSGQALRIFRRSSRAQTIKAFMGRLMWGFPSVSFFAWRIILAPSNLSVWVTVLVSVLLFGELGIEESEVIPLVGGRLPVGIPARDDFDRFKGASSELMGGKSTCGVHLEANFPSPKALIACQHHLLRVETKEGKNDHSSSEGINCATSLDHKLPSLNCHKEKNSPVACNVVTQCSNDKPLNEQTIVRKTPRSFCSSSIISCPQCSLWMMIMMMMMTTKN